MCGFVYLWVQLLQKTECIGTPGGGISAGYELPYVVLGTEPLLRKESTNSQPQSDPSSPSLVLI